MEKITRHNYEAFFLDFLEGCLSDEQKLEMEAFLAENPDLAEELEDFENVSLQPDAVPAKWDSLKIPTVRELMENDSLREQLYFRCSEGEANDYDKSLLTELLTRGQFKEEYALWSNLKLDSSNEVVDRAGLYQLPLLLPITSVNFEDFLIARTERILSEKESQELEKYAAGISGGERQLALADSLRLKAPLGVFYPFKNELKKKKKGLVLFYRAAAILILFGLSASIFTLLDREVNSDPKYAQREIVQSSPDSLNILESEKDLKGDTIPDDADQYELEEWEVREPDQIFIAEKETAPAEEKSQPSAPAVENDFDELQYAEANPVEIKKVEEVEIVEPDLEIPEEDEPVLAQDNPANSPVEYQTIGELAQNRVADEFDLSDGEKDELALSVAKRIAQKAGEALDSEVKKEIDEDADRLTYSLRIRGFKLSHSKSK